MFWIVNSFLINILWRKSFTRHSFFFLNISLAPGGIEISYILCFCFGFGKYIELFLHVPTSLALVH